MDKFKKRFVATRKDLPKDWAMQVSKHLAIQGIIVKPSKISDVRRGKVKDEELILRINIIVKEMRKKVRKQRKIQPII